MATVQTSIQVGNEATSIPTEQQTDLFSLTVAALVTNRWISSRQETTPTKPEERIISLDEVSWHDNACDCWVVIYDRVYDITDFLYEHPGGADILLEYAGRDASIPFRGTGHSKAAEQSLKLYLIGELPIHERMYRNPGGIQLSDLPE